MRYSPFLLFLFACATSEEKISIYNDTPEVSIVSHTSGSEFYEGVTDTFQATISDGNHTLTELSVTWSTNLRNVCTDMSPTIDGSIISAKRLLEKTVQRVRE